MQKIMEDIQKLIQKLVINECACYSPSMNGIEYIKHIPHSITIKNYCDKEQEKDCRCLIFKNKSCDYFEKAVLPMNPQLEAIYKAQHEGDILKAKKIEAMSTVKGKVNIHCKRCGKIFQANYRQQYCDRCRRYIRRENQRKWIENKRGSNVDNQLSKTVDI